MSNIDIIAKYLSVPPSIARYIIEHGLTPQTIARADIPALSDPFGHSGISESSGMINEAVGSRKTIAVSGDGSADATAAAAVLIRALNKMGARSTATPEEGALSIAIGQGRRGETADITLCPPTPTPPTAIGLGTGDQIASLFAFSLVHALYLSREKYFGRRIIAIDTETTGKNSWTNEIIEIGAVQIEGNKLTDTFSMLMNPGKRIPSEIVRITGITNEEVAGAPDPAEALSSFLDFAGDAVLVAHNAPFDYDFLRRAIRKHLGRRVDFDTIDTLQMARTLHPAMPSHRLAHVAENLGIEVTGWHRALGDAVMAAHIYLILSEQQNARRKKFNAKRLMDLASLGIVASGKALDNDCAVIIKNGLPQYRLDKCAAMIGGSPEELGSREIIDLLLSWRRKKNQQGAVALLAPLLRGDTIS